MEPATALRAEIRRLKHHFDGALAMLALRDSARLPRPRRDRRAKLTRELRKYQARGRFPRNDRFRAQMPFFVDADGTRCAMAHLIDSSGHARLVERVAALQNNAFVRELASDAELQDWLLGHGMTLAEAARIQPGYRPEWAAAEFCNGAPFKEVVRASAAADKVTVVEVYASSSALRVGQVLPPESITGTVPWGREVFLAMVPVDAGVAWWPTSHQLTSGIISGHISVSDGMGTTSRVPLAEAARALMSPNCVQEMTPFMPRPSHGGNVPADQESASGCARCSSAQSAPVEAGAAISMASLLLLCGWARRLHR